jgi:hypothetical protein
MGQRVCLGRCRGVEEILFYIMTDMYTMSWLTALAAFGCESILRDKVACSSIGFKVHS